MKVSEKIRNRYEMQQKEGYSKTSLISWIVEELFLEKNGRPMEIIEMWDNHSELENQAREIIDFLNEERWQQLIKG